MIQSNIIFTEVKLNALVRNTHQADPRLQFPVHRPVLMCQAYRCIYIHIHP